MSVDPLSIGATGLSAYDQQLNVDANNVANVGSSGFESQDVTFQDILASFGGPGGGVKVATIDANGAQGGLATTGNPTDFAIDGNGFFVLQQLGGGGQTFTRDGHFSLDANGNLVDPSTGLVVQGLSPSGALAPIAIPLGLQSQAVGTGFGPKTGPTGDRSFDVSFGGNLDQSLYVAAASGGPAQPVTLGSTVYDSLGNAHAVNVTFTPVPLSAGGVDPATQTVNDTHGNATAVGTEWSWTIAKANPSDPAVFPATTGYAFFGQTGQFINTSSDPTGQTNTHNAGPVAPSGVEGNLVTVNNWGLPSNNSVPASIALDFSSMSSLAGSSSATTLSQNGSGAGTLQTISVGADGTITGAYSNGQQAVLGRVALASFANPNGLERLGSGELQATAASGSPQIGAPGSGALGSLQSGALELSNVSLGDEFVKMMIAQAAFQANAKTVSTGEQQIDTILNL
ncbi:MAG: flagellar hook-basal body complex protein [Candidatus Eremiobacteraeota bacterium]|nr:flagellar hook-basal body complex protein [Candidatus Eremiobacteraeota bacterium]